MVLKPDSSKDIEVFVDADFSGNCQKAGSQHPENCLFRTGYVIHHNKCSIIWKSQMQTETTFDTAEIEYVVISQALWTNFSTENLLQ